MSALILALVISAPPVVARLKVSEPSPVEQQMLAELRRQRPDLVVDMRLVYAARKHAQCMARHRIMSHNLQGTCSVRARTFGYHGGVGENIAYGQHSAQQVQGVWLRSPGHARNIYNRSYRRVGVAVGIASNGQRYWVQVFGQ